MRRVFLFLLLIAAAALAGAFAWERMNFVAPGPKAAKGEETVVLIQPGEGVSAIAQDLARAHVVENATLFGLGVRIRGVGGRLKAGEYAIPSRASMADVAGILMAGTSIEHKLTVAEGLTSQMAYDLVKADPVLTGDAGPVPLEGSLLPETYLFTRGTTRAQLIARMMKAEDDLLMKLWAGRDKDLPLKTPLEAVILASVVEKETAIPAERAHIAAVFENRLKLGMKLQSDPTIIYGLTRGLPLGRGIRESEIAKPTAYNTYIITGLPPGPICNPGRDSLYAVLHPEKSKDLYFVADGDGGHVFAATMAEHQKNVARWRKIERAEKAAPR
ncbi:MAG: endolytic transglycosylase MltG [Pseudomonadota bacterium]|nr:endolytic transglycosylase MltG [Pseudomonadota bacterium]